MCGADKYFVQCKREPIVCTPTDAFRCFMATEMDVLAIGDFLLLKKEQPSNFKIAIILHMIWIEKTFLIFLL